MKVKKKEVLVIGGGTGTYTVLTGLKKYPHLNLSVIVSMMDSGGSNRIIRDEFGLLPTSDIRQCMVALSSEKPSEIVRKLFTYRYSQGTGISGMTFGNLFMAALTDIYGSQAVAIEKTNEFLDVQGNIIPVTFDNSQLVAKYSDGKQILGEHMIDEPDGKSVGDHHIIKLETIPKAKANKKAIEAVKKADLIVFGPGDLYTSTICNLVVDGISDAVKKSRAKIVFVVNLMTKYGQTHGYKASDHLITLEKYIGEGKVDVCLVHKNSDFPKALTKRYKMEKAEIVRDDLRSIKNGKLKIICRKFVSKRIYEKPKSDKLFRSLIRHDPDKLAKAIISLI